MTAVVPPPAPPVHRPKPPRRRRTRARALVLVTIGSLILAALLNPDDLLKRARQQPFGWRHDVLVRLADVNRDVSRTLWLDRPRRALDELFGTVPTPGASAEPTPTPAPTTGPTAAPTSPTTPTAGPPPRTPTAAHPLRLYVGGDSVAQAVSEAFQRIARATRLVKATIDFRFSTGLSRPDYFDWPARLRAVAARTPPPEAIVVMFGANDVQPIMTPSGPAKPGTTAWLAEYRRRVASTMQMLSGTGIPVFWLGQPLMRSAFFTARINELDAIYSSEAARHTGITFIDTRPALSDSRGHYAAYLPGADGAPVLVRGPDGVHLTEAGGARVSQVLMLALRKHWPFPQ